MSLTWPGWYLPEADEPIKFAPAPNKVGDGDEEHTSTSIYGIWYLGVASNSQNKELAMEYIDYITTPRNHDRIRQVRRCAHPSQLLSG